ncbi:SDR family NAD(P)-dependent oxidoreductase [Psychrosphaera haliotis]|nr:SDR family NAD(P)-dependent oxidoreductase [Psychrosphaera haliotis]
MSTFQLLVDSFVLLKQKRVPNMSQRVLVTGATSGIGHSLVINYLEKGDVVYACGRSAEKLAAISEQAQQLSGTLKLVQFDQLEENELVSALNEVEALDIAILNAGDCEYIDIALDFDANLFKRVIDINLTSVGVLVREILPKLKEATTANSSVNPQLVFVGSSAAMMPFTRAQAYGASKAGIGYLADSLYIDLKPHNIDVSLVLPGFIKTPLTDKNDFEMPFLLTSDEAAKRIDSGIQRRHRHIAFPKRLIWSLKFASWLPATWWRKIMLNSDQ